MSSHDIGAPDPAPELQFPTLDVFVEDFIAVLWERSVSGVQTAWCPRWWMHDEAVFRLTSLWQAWEEMHVTEGAMAGAKWLAYYADPIMGVLLSADGAFKGCSVERGHQSRRPHPDARLPCDPAPAGLFSPRE